MYLREQRRSENYVFIQLVNFAIFSCSLFFFKLIYWPFKVNGIFTTGLIGIISPFICEKQFLFLLLFQNGSLPFLLSLQFPKDL